MRNVGLSERAFERRFVAQVGLTPVADIESALGNERLIVPKRTTFYGATEAGYTDPAGNIVIFSEHQAARAGS